MSAEIIPFDRSMSARPQRARTIAVGRLVRHFGRHWSVRHLPLVLAAFDMLEADDADFGARCRLIASEPGALTRMVDQLSRLASHMADAADALRVLAQRLHATPFPAREQPA